MKWFFLCCDVEALIPHLHGNPRLHINIVCTWLWMGVWYQFSRLEVLFSWTRKLVWHSHVQTTENPTLLYYRPWLEIGIASVECLHTYQVLRSSVIDVRATVSVNVVCWFFRLDLKLRDIEGAQQLTLLIGFLHCLRTVRCILARHIWA